MMSDHPTDAHGCCQSSVAVLSSSLLTDRMLSYTGFLSAMENEANVQVWATSGGHSRSAAGGNGSAVCLEAFPKIRPFREFPYNYLRRLNEYAWDFRHRPPSRMSVMRHVRDKRAKLRIRVLKAPARLLALTGMEQRFENWLERLLLSYDRSQDAYERLSAAPPACLLCTGPHRFEEPAIVATAKNLGIPTLALITSWDNLSTKNRMVFQYDGYVVWSPKMKEELHQFYPNSQGKPVYVVGAPQFDVFFQERFKQSREDFCAAQGLRPDRPIIVHALGSPNFLREHHAALHMAERVERGELGDAQLIVRPHPMFDKGAEAQQLRGFGSSVIVQQTGDIDTDRVNRSQDESQIAEWVNTFRHADVVVNLSSTVAIDAAIFDRPVVNLDFDPEPGQPNQELVKDVNHLWTHFKPIAESGGVWLVNNLEEMVQATKTYLEQPELHREKRRWIAEYVCGYLDGRCGQRMAEAVLDFVSNQPSSANTK